MERIAERREPFFVLDALRGVAAILVAFYHFGIIVPLLIYYHGGPLAVDFFFCLSGFVIAHSYETRLLTRMTVARFMALRLIRLYPLYALGTALGIVQWLLYRQHWNDAAAQSVGPIHTLLTALAGFLFIPTMPLKESVPQILQYPFDFAGWSLAFELIINLLYGFIARHLTRPASRRADYLLRSAAWRRLLA